MPIRKTVSVILAVSLCFLSFSGILASAEAKSFDIQVSSATAIPGDSIVLNVGIENNPGIMAVTVTVHFDPDVFEYEKYVVGFLRIDTLVLHPGYLSVVYCRKSDLTGDGTLFGLGLKVKENAPAGNYSITVKNSRCEDTLDGAFANWDSDKLIGTAHSGTVTVGYTGDNCVHSFGEYVQTVPSGCTEVGVKSRSCRICGHTEAAETEASGHNYSELWTIDSAATDEQSGVMSRHCSHCDSVKDKISFSLVDSEANGFLNTVGIQLEAGSWKPLQYEINSENITETGEAQNEETAENPILKPELEIKPETDDSEQENSDVPTAAELIEEVKAKEKTGFMKWISYIFGGDESIGILGVIRASLPKKFSSGFLMILALPVLIFGILV